MKKLVRILILVLTLSFLVPVQAYAAPTGYKVVKITKKNAKKYFGFKKVKSKDEFGDYTGYSYRMYSKLRKKGYLVYDTKKFALKMSHKERYKYKDSKKKWYTDTWKDTDTISYIGDSLPRISGKNYNYKYAKLLNTKIKKAKGTVIFIKPDNVIGIEKNKNEDGEVTSYGIKLKYPYDKHTPYKEHYDEATGKWVIDYYYKTIYDTGAWKYY